MKGRSRPLSWSHRLRHKDSTGSTDSIWLIEPAGLNSVTEVVTTTLTTITVSGGTHGVLYKLSNLVNTNESRKPERTLLLRVWDNR